MSANDPRPICHPCTVRHGELEAVSLGTSAVLAPTHRSTPRRARSRHVVVTAPPNYGLSTGRSPDIDQISREPRDDRSVAVAVAAARIPSRPAEPEPINAYQTAAGQFCYSLTSKTPALSRASTLPQGQRSGEQSSRASRDWRRLMGKKRAMLLVLAPHWVENAQPQRLAQLLPAGTEVSGPTPIACRRPGLALELGMHAAHRS